MSASRSVLDKTIEVIAHLLDRRFLPHRLNSTSRCLLGQTYEQAVRLHLVPGIGKIPIARLTPIQLDAWLRMSHANGASARNIRYARTVLRAALNQAKKWRAVSDNVATLAEVPRYSAKEIRPLTPEQARTLLDAAKASRLGGLGSVATALGLRLGEALGQGARRTPP